MKKLFYAVAGATLLAYTQVTSALVITGKGEDTLAGSVNTLETGISALINYFATFITLIAVIYAIFGGFTILTAAGDEEKVKKGRTIIFHAILGIIVIWLAYSIINWVVTLLANG